MSSESTEPSLIDQIAAKIESCETLDIVQDDYQLARDALCELVSQYTRHGATTHANIALSEIHRLDSLYWRQTSRRTL